jgi:nicotinamide-nucleotide amidase
VDTNAPWIARAAAEEGVLRAWHTVVGDDLEDLVAAFRAAGERSDLVVVTGGLGPTADDHTREAAAKAAGCELQTDPELLEAIQVRFRERGRTMHAGNERQALIPEDATATPNPLGTAPGFRMRIGAATFFFLSGVPREMEVMFEAWVRPALREARGEVEGAYRVLSTFGRAEAWVNERISDLLARRDVSVGLTAIHGRIRVTIQVVGPDAARIAEEVEAEARRRLGDVVLEEPTLEESVGGLLLARGLTLGIAESCTGGLVGKLLTDVPGISAAFAGSLVTYANEAKIAVLGVPPDLLAEEGAVSEPVARAMAEGARRVLGTDLAVAVTGVAGPSGGTAEKPVGLVWFALAAPDGTEATSRRFPGDRVMVRGFSANTALGLVRRWLLR